MLKGALSPLFFKKMNEEQELSFALHSLNVTSNEFNKNMVQKSATMGDVPIHKEVYEQAAAKEAARVQQIQQIQQIQQAQQAQQAQAVQPTPVPQSIPAPQQQDLTPLIDRVTALEKQVTKFVNLIERNVAKNAKEINIRIKLNEQTNDSKNKQ